jgi:O-antigen/teichoic acid export membrane protein
MNDPTTFRARTLRSAASSLAQLVVSTISLFVLYRVVLDILGAREFGVWSLVVAATSMVGLANMGLTGSMVKHVAETHGAGEIKRLSGMIETTVISVALLSIVLSVAGYPLMKAYFAATLPADAYRSAVLIMPIALVAFCLSMITGIYQSVLYGCHLIVQRNAILIFESLSFLCLSLILAPRYGLYGLVYARAVQNLITLLLSVTVLKRYLPSMPLIPLHWTKSLFKELIGYALGFQFISILNMVMDPLTKGLISRFGSLEMVTYFEMGTRLIGQVRGIVVNANQVLVPTFAHINRTEAAQVKTLFRRSYEIIFYVTVCLFGLLAAALPLLGLLWLGKGQPMFVNIATVLCFGWLVNTLGVPAYFASLGTGAMGLVVKSHAVMAMLNVGLGFGLGWLWGGYGVVAAWAIALASGGLVVHIAYCRRIGYGWRDLVPARGAGLAAFCGLGLLIGHLAMHWTNAAVLGDTLKVSELLSSAAGLLCFVAVFLLPALLHPVRRDLVRWVLERRTEAHR